MLDDAITEAARAMRCANDGDTAVALAKLLAFDAAPLLATLARRVVAATAGLEAITRNRANLVARYGGEERFASGDDLVVLLDRLAHADADAARVLAGGGFDELMVLLVSALSVLEADGEAEP